MLLSLNESMKKEPEKTYSGLIDWNAVYRKYYQLDNIENRLLDYLKKPCQLTFSGFGEIASRLSRHCRVHFIEYSDSMVQSARREFPEIDQISNANILDSLKHDKSQVLFIVCRITAYWHRFSDLQRFVDGVNCAQYELVVVDFFDEGKLESGGALGQLEYSDVRVIRDEEFSRDTLEPMNIRLAKIDGTYSVNKKLFEYSEIRAYYKPSEVSTYFTTRMNEYDVAIESPIVDGDPGFTVVLRKRVRS